MGLCAPSALCEYRLRRFSRRTRRLKRRNRYSQRADGAQRPMTNDERPPTNDPAPDEDPLWYKDAVIYQAHVKSFFDSNNDGVGDFPGLTQKLDYLQGLGVTCVWLLPFFPSPLKDDGYDIADYTTVHPSYGTVDDFKAFVDTAHQRGLRVLIELVVNHTSDQ